MLLILQYVWFKNSYVLIEQEIIAKSEVNLTKSVEDELFERVKRLNFDIKIQDRVKSNEKVIASGGNNQSNDINTGLQEIALFMGSKCSLKRVDSIFHEKIIESIGFSPHHTISFIDSKKKDKEKPSKFKIFAKITDKQYILVVLDSPLGSILKQAQYILGISAMLVLVIGVILVYQLKSMLRENKFVNFIRDYTHALTHELKTPISGIYMSSSQLASGIFEDKPESRKRYYQMCKDQSSKLLTTVDKILLVAKAEHSQITTSKTEIAVKPFVDQIVENHLKNNFRKKDIEIVTAFEPEILDGFFDTFLIENVLNNLIDNAVKYSESSVRIWISCSKVEKYLQILIKDNGFGISKAELKHIFENFERGNKVEGKGIDGFGIGLNYVNKVIKAHKGKISVKSEEGKGTEFQILLPYK